MKNNKLKGALACAVPLAEAVFYRNSAPHTPAERSIGPIEPLVNHPNITPYVGNFPESFFVPAASGLIGDYIEHTGRQRGNRALQRIGKYFPEIAALAIGSYFTLGETILPRILPGSADARDVPAVLISVAAGYALAKVGRKSGLNNKIAASLTKAKATV